MELARPGHRGNTRGGQPTPPTMPSVRHTFAVEVPEWVIPAHMAVQEGAGAR